MYSPVRFLVVAAALSLGLGACASSGSRGPQVDPDVITFEELQEDPDRDLLTVVRSLRPRWLRARASRTFVGEAAIGVIVDGLRQNEGVGALYTLRADEAVELRYLNAVDATTKYGTGMTAGAIEVTLRR